MNNLSKQEIQDIKFLMKEHAYSTMEATAVVLKQKTKVRAPTIEEIEKISASQIGAYSKC